MAFFSEKKHKLLNLLLCLELAITMFFINQTFNDVDNMRRYLDTIIKADVGNSLLYMNEFGLDDDGSLTSGDLSGMNKALSKIKEQPAYQGVADVYEAGLRCKPESLWFNTPTEFGVPTYSVFTYDDLTAERFRSPLSAGKWFTDAKVAEGNIPCVVLLLQSHLNRKMA